MASASRIRAFQLLSSRTLEFLCEEASAHRPAPLERLGGRRAWIALSLSMTDSAGTLARDVGGSASRVTV